MQSTVSGYFVAAVVKAAQSRAMPVEQWLNELDIQPEILRLPEKRISPQQFTRLVQRLWSETNDEYMGFFDQPAKPGTFYMMSLATIHGKTLRSFFTRSIKFYELTTRNFQFELTLSGDRACLELSEVQARMESSFLIEALLAVWHRFACWLCGQQIMLSQAQFSFPAPKHVREYPALFLCPVSFNRDRNCIEFPAEVLDFPIVQNERSLRMFLRSSPVALLSRLSMRGSLSNRIRQRLSRHPINFQLSALSLASEFHMSAPSLRRKLREEGTSFQEIRDNLRRDLALSALDQQASVEELCHTIGFSDPSAFYRAFKRWTGMTPIHYMRQSSQDACRRRSKTTASLSDQLQIH